MAPSDMLIDGGQKLQSSLARISTKTVDDLVKTNQAVPSKDGDFVMVPTYVAGEYVDLLLQKSTVPVISAGAAAVTPRLTGNATFYSLVRTFPVESVPADASTGQIEATLSRQLTTVTDGKNQADLLETAYEVGVRQDRADAQAAAAQAAGSFVLGMIPVVGTVHLGYQIATSKEGLTAANAASLGLSIAGDLGFIGGKFLSAAAKTAATAKGSKYLLVGARVGLAIDGATQGAAGLYSLYQATQAEDWSTRAGYMGSALLRLLGATSSMANAIGTRAPHLGVDAPSNVAGVADEAFHYTSKQWGDAIKREGLRPGTYATPNGSLGGLQAQLELALPPNRAAPNIRIRIDIEGLRKAGYEIPTPSRVSSTVRGADGRVYQMPGGGWEMKFPYEIPPEFLEVLPIK
jgi:hypothetical protein